MASVGSTNGTSDYTDGSEWILGSHNIDEDLHYSSYFLRASVGVYGAGPTSYEKLVSAYSGTDEFYWVREGSAAAAAESLVRIIEERPMLWHEVVSAITKSIEGLDKIYAAWRRQCDDGFVGLDAAIDFYSSHHSAIEGLYRYARVPEVLDRGRPWFTSRIRRRLAAHLGMAEPDPAVGVALASALYDADSEQLSPFRRDFLAMATEVRQQLAVSERHAVLGRPGLARMFLTPSLLTRLYSFHRAYRFLWYHGYIRRSFRTFDETIDSVVRRAMLDDIGSEDSENREEEIALTGIEQELFQAYKQAAALKLRRRLAQLRLFPLLDESFRLFASHLDTTERVLRHCLPEEIMGLLGGDRSAIEDAHSRSRGCVVAWSQDSVEFSFDKQVMQGWLDTISLGEIRADRQGVWHGEPVVPGIIEGIAVVADRDVDVAGMPDFILVSESTDLGMLEVIMAARAVVTARGGVTSHAAIVCRELNIPCVVGVPGIARHVTSGDYLTLDAARGLVRRIG